MSAFPHPPPLKSFGRAILHRVTAAVFALAVLAAGCGSEGSGGGDRAADGDTLRVMSYNIEDVRTPDVRSSDHPRLTEAAARIQALRPDILLINEMTVDQAGTPGYREGEPERQNARRFAENYLAAAQADSLEGLDMQPIMLPTNTGLHSGFDLNNDGRIAGTIPEVPGPPADGSVPAQTDAGRAYGNDAWGFGTFPGQYGMALFVREGLTVVRDSIRTFRLFEWSKMPGALVPTDSVTGERWYSDAEWDAMRLSSKSHWDVPVRLPGGSLLHVLAAHPTPPGFDGAADRNGRRNHDEIRLLADYMSGADYVRSDSGRVGGLGPDARFVVLGDMNADPGSDGLSGDAARQLTEHPRVQGEVVPTAAPFGRSAVPDAAPEATSDWGGRIDYALPSTGLTVTGSGVLVPSAPRPTPPVSDHFPVWIDVVPSAEFGMGNEE